MTKAMITAGLAVIAAITTAAMLTEQAAVPVAAQAGREVLLPAMKESELANLLGPQAATSFLTPPAPPQKLQEPLVPSGWSLPSTFAPEARTTRPGRPQAPWQVVAHAALAEKWGPLDRWQIAGYQHLLQNGVTRKTAWITYYWKGEPGVGNVTASGRRVERGRTAAMLDMAWGTFVLVQRTDGH